jgi:hypothetical protein
MSGEFANFHQQQGKEFQSHIESAHIFIITPGKGFGRQKALSVYHP